jgi:hypothetical protein
MPCLPVYSGQYFLKSTLKCFHGNVSFTSSATSHKGVLVHGPGHQTVLEVGEGATVSLKGLSILQYVALDGHEFVSFGTDLTPSLWPSCISATLKTQVVVESCFLHSRSGSGIVAIGKGCKVNIVSSEMHGCRYAAAAAFEGGCITVSNSRAQWSHIYGFCAKDKGSSMMIHHSHTNDCGKHGIKAMQGAFVKALSCTAVRNGFAGFVSSGLEAKLSVKSSFSLQVNRSKTANVLAYR